MDKLITSESYSNKPDEVSDIRAVCQNGENEVSEIYRG